MGSVDASSRGLRNGRKQLIASAEALHCIGPARSLPNLGHNAEDAAGDFFLSLFFQRVDGLAHSPSSFVRHKLHAHLVWIFPARVMME